MCLRICQINSLASTRTNWEYCPIGHDLRILLLRSKENTVLCNYWLCCLDWVYSPFTRTMATNTRQTNLYNIECNQCHHVVHVWLSAEPDTELGRFMGELQSSTFDKLEELFTTSSNPVWRILNTREAMEINVNYQVKTSRNYYVSTHT